MEPHGYESPSQLYYTKLVPLPIEADQLGTSGSRNKHTLAAVIVPSVLLRDHPFCSPRARMVWMEAKASINPSDLPDQLHTNIRPSVDLCGLPQRPSIRLPSFVLYIQVVPLSHTIAIPSEK